MTPIPRNRHARAVSALAIAAVLGAAAAQAAPEAGAVIGNQAVATYVNGAGDTITVTSNKVETIVQQVAGLTLTTDNTEELAPGGKAFLPHTLVNEGNGPDSFALSAAETGGAFDFTSVVIYPDANLDGVPDSTTPITATPVLGAGERFGFVIEATAPSTATAGQSEGLAVLATSATDGTVTSTNTDTLTIANGPIMDLVKSMVVNKSAGDPSIVDAGDTVTVTLTYANTGLAAATSYAVQDVLDARLPYRVTSAQWSDRAVAGGLDETNGAGIDATNGAGDTIAYQYNAAANTVDLQISRVPAGRTGSVTFEAVIGATVAAGPIANTATQSDSTGTYPPSNTAVIEVDAQYAVVLDDRFTQPDTTLVVSGTDDGAAGDDVILETSNVSQGGQIVFEFVLANDSNRTDSYTLGFNDVDFPPGTTFRMVGADGATPVVGTVGPLGAGKATRVSLIAILPGNLAPAAAGATNYTATLTATSQASGATDPSTAEFTGAVVAAAVDLENLVAGAEGDGASPTNGGLPWSSLTTDPGTSISYPMRVENLGPTSDSYNLSLATPLPAGWTVEFQLADGTVVTNTGTIPSGSFADIVVIVTPSEDAAPGTTDIEIAVLSPVSGQGDSIVNQVSVNQIVDLAITEDQTAQAGPGGVVDIRHTLTNEGNVTITEGALTATGLSSFSGALYWDQNGDGVLDPSDPIVDNVSDLGGLAPGATAALIYRVQTGSVPGISEIGTVAVATSLNGGAASDGDTGDNAVEDRVSVVSGDVTLVKTQAIDALCNGTLGGFSKDRQPVEPGQCIRYRIVADNTGTSPASNVVIKDNVPAYTAYETCGGTCAAVATPAGSSSADTSGAPLIQSSHGALSPGSSAALEFTVRVDG